MTMIIVPFSSTHLLKTVDLLLEVRNVDGTYPPAVDAENTVSGFSRWLMSEETVGRWVALMDGDVAGHISLTPAHGYLTQSLDDLGYVGIEGRSFCEVSKFFVDPQVQRQGVGAKLFDYAIEQGWALGLQPALAVIDTSYAARRFYARKGMLEVGSFHGVHGENFVFVDEGSFVAVSHS